MRLIGYQTYAQLHRARRPLMDRLPTGDAGDRAVGYTIGGIAVVLLTMAMAGLL